MTVSTEPDETPNPQRATGPGTSRTRLAAADPSTAQPAAGAQDTMVLSRAEVSAASGADAHPAERPAAEPPQPELVPATAEALVQPGHASTAEERSAFAAAVGTWFEDSLPSVNGALASYPVLREAALGGDAKADFVAVHLYIGSGTHGGTAINRALRGGDGTSVREQVACLVSGLRRLPVHRGASFRTARYCEGRSPLSAYRPGAVLDEPGFLSATAANDLTVEQEHVDVVIWSCSARRTAALGRGVPDEVVFTAASRFKVLAVEENEDATPAVLLRELRPGEDGEAGVLTAADEALLPRLRRALGRRRSAELHPLDDDQAERLGEPIGLVLREPITSAAPRPVPATAH